LTGQNPLHHGLLRPPKYGEAGGLEGAETVVSILKRLVYRTQGVGEWYMGEMPDSVPQDICLDGYYRFLGVSYMYTEWRDVYFNPETQFTPAGLKSGFSGAIVKKTGGVTAVNLYNNPQEDLSVGIRHLPITISLGQEAARYGEVLKKYPPKMTAFGIS
jgi:hypothetical protein